MIRHVVFDLDGTLLDSLDGIVETFCMVMKKKGLPCPADRVTSLIREGKNLPQLYRAVLSPGPGELVDELVSAYIPLYEKNFPGGAALYDGVVPMLESLAGKGNTMALATSKRSKVAGIALHYFGIENYFDYVCGFEDVARHKPHPDILIRIMDELDWDPGETLMVGDTTADIHAGKAAGIRTCAALYGFSLPGVLGKLGADFYIREPMELLEVI